jgi:hypothetical protein
MVSKRGSDTIKNESSVGKIDPKYWHLAVGGLIGFSVAFVLAWALLMSPRDMVRWIISEEPVRQRLARIFTPSEQIVELRASVAKEHDAFVTCRADYEEQRKRTDDLEFKVSAFSGPTQAGQKVSSDTCALDFRAVRGIHLTPGESARHVGGRIYAGLRYIEGGYDSQCAVIMTSDTDIKPDAAWLHVAQAERINSSMGQFRLIVTKIGAGYCEFDLIRE